MDPPFCSGAERDYDTIFLLSVFPLLSLGYLFRVAPR